MAALSRKLRSAEGGRLAFHCPGCETRHMVVVDGRRGWTWNGDAERPTIKPSVLTNKGGGNPMQPICHCFITAGRIRFLNDCTHHLAGQTVDLPDWA